MLSAASAAIANVAATHKPLPMQPDCCGGLHSAVQLTGGAGRAGAASDFYDFGTWERCRCGCVQSVVEYSYAYIRKHYYTYYVLSTSYCSIFSHFILSHGRYSLLKLTRTHARPDRGPARRRCRFDEIFRRRHHRLQLQQAPQLLGFRHIASSAISAEGHT